MQTILNYTLLIDQKQS